MQPPPPPASPSIESALTELPTGGEERSPLDAALFKFEQAMGGDQVERLREFLESAKAYAEGAGRAPKPVLLGPIADKGTRTAVHQMFKGISGLPTFSTTTVPAPAGPVAGAGAAKEGETDAGANLSTPGGSAAAAAGDILQCIEVQVRTYVGGAHTQIVCALLLWLFHLHWQAPMPGSSLVPCPSLPTRTPLSHLLFAGGRGAEGGRWQAGRLEQAEMAR
jgi:hypothetical protein